MLGMNMDKILMISCVLISRIRGIFRVLRCCGQVGRATANIFLYSLKCSVIFPFFSNYQVDDSAKTRKGIPMTAPVPATIVSELNDELNRMALTRDFNEFAVRRIKNKAQSLKTLDAFAYHSLLGRTDCLLQDLDQMRSHLKAAIALSPTDSGAYLDYAISVSMWGYHNEAWEYMQYAQDRASGDPAILRRVLREAWKSCRFMAVRKLLDRLELLKAELEDELNPYDDLQKACTLFQTENLSDEQGAEAAEAFGAFLRNHKIFNPPESINYLYHPDGRAHIVYTCDLNEKDPESLNWELFEYFSDLDIEIEKHGYIAFKFVPEKNTDVELVA